jgi:hypothetical protein
VILKQAKQNYKRCEGIIAVLCENARYKSCKRSICGVKSAIPALLTIIVRRRQPLRAARLRRHDGAHLRFRQIVTRHHAGDLHFLGQSTANSA